MKYRNYKNRKTFLRDFIVPQLDLCISCQPIIMSERGLYLFLDTHFFTLLLSKSNKFYLKAVSKDFLPDIIFKFNVMVLNDPVRTSDFRINRQ